MSAAACFSRSNALRSASSVSPSRRGDRFAFVGQLFRYRAPGENLRRYLADGIGTSSRRGEAEKDDEIRAKPERRQRRQTDAKDAVCAAEPEIAVDVASRSAIARRAPFPKPRTFASVGATSLAY